MFVLEEPPVRSSPVRLDELEDAFRAWLHDPAKPDVVALGQHGEVPRAELLHATVDPDGPRCRSFRAATSYLRGLSRLGADFQARPPARLERRELERSPRCPLN